MFGISYKALKNSNSKKKIILSWAIVKFQRDCKITFRLNCDYNVGRNGNHSNFKTLYIIFSLSELFFNTSLLPNYISAIVD
jgi:hypothetical protein